MVEFTAGLALFFQCEAFIQMYFTECCTVSKACFPFIFIPVIINALPVFSIVFVGGIRRPISLISKFQ